MSAVVEASALGKRRGSTWALRDCTLDLPTGRSIALVGPNGAGKTTFLELLVGLLKPTEGSVTVCGERPFARPAELLPRVTFVAQDQPLYRSMTGDDLFRIGAAMNPRWDDAFSRTRLRQLDIPLDRPVGQLSGGQRAQVALGLSLAKQAQLVILDEPLASLDPLARREFLQTLMEAQAQRQATLLLSSHIIADLERVCDYLVILSAAHVQLATDIDQALATHRRLIGPRSDLAALSHVHEVVFSTHAERQTTAVIRASAEVFDPIWEVHPMTLEEIVLAYLSQARANARRSGARG